MRVPTVNMNLMIRVQRNLLITKHLSLDLLIIPLTIARYKESTRRELIHPPRRQLHACSRQPPVIYTQRLPILALGPIPRVN